MTVYYEAAVYNKDGDYMDVEDGTCAPESIAAVLLVHYPVQEGWIVEFWADEDEE